MNILNFGQCPACRQGTLVAVKCIDNNQLLLMCDDCESQWPSPEAARTFNGSLQEECHNIIDAQIEDIASAGWTIPAQG